MNNVRFNHIFFTLMLLAALSAFFSPRISEFAQAQLQMLFKPISTPIYATAGWVHGRFVAKVVRDDGSPDHPRDANDLIRENTDLRMQLMTLTAELDRFKELDADRNRLGDLRDRCISVEVAGGDAGLHDSLMLSAGKMSGLKDGMPVLCPDGVVGRLTHVGADASRVQLITDRGSTITVSFARFENDANGVIQLTNVSYPDCVATGEGKGKMIIKNLKPWDALLEAVKVNDWAVLNDHDWPQLRYCVGKVKSIEPQPGVAGFGQIEIESVVDLNLLQKVMVMNK